MKKIIIFLFIIAAIKTVAQTKLSPIKLIGKNTGDSVVLRWAPTDLSTWREMLKNGFWIEKGVLVDKDTFYIYAKYKKVFQQPIKAMSLEKMTPLARQNEQFAIAAETIYGNASKLKGKTVFDAKDNQDEREMRWSFAMLTADQNAEVAMAMGLRCVDEAPEQGKAFIYRVYANGIKSDTASILIKSNDIKKLPAPPVLNSLGLEHAAFLSWETDKHYSSYFIEKSEDNGKTFKKIKKYPLPNLKSDTLHPNITKLTFTDSLTTNYQPVTYRVYGITAFGEKGLYSNVCKEMGRDRTAPTAPTISECLHSDKNVFYIKWEKRIIEPDFVGFRVEHSNKYEGGFKPLHEKTLSRNIFEFKHKNINTSEDHFYRIIAVDTAGNANVSYVTNGVIIDTIAPIKPNGLTGKVDTNGIVYLHWHIGKEPDIKGYRIFFANAEHHTFSNRTGFVLQDTIFKDTITLQTLTHDIFYKIVAIDMHGNHSVFSDVLRLKRPDKIAPVAPVLINSEVVENQIIIAWEKSSSDDVKKQELLLRKEGEKEWKVIESLMPNIDNWVFKNLENKTNYQISLLAYDDSGNKSTYAFPLIISTYESNFKNESLKLKSIYQKETQNVQLSWQFATKKKVDFYVLTKAEDGNPMVSFKSLPNDKNIFLDTKISYNHTYRYGLKAVYTDGSESILEEGKVLEVAK